MSLALWVFCPNVLAHGRLITTDMGSTSLGVAATFVFWLYLQKPSWRRAVAAGILLGLAELTKFSMLLLYAVWPVLWLFQLIVVWPQTDRLARARRSLVHGAVIVTISFLTIDAGYLFEGVGKPLGRFEFGSRTLTTWVKPGMKRPHSPNSLLDVVWQFRVNRFRERGSPAFRAHYPSTMCSDSTNRRSRPRACRGNGMRRFSQTRARESERRPAPLKSTQRPMPSPGY